MQSNVPVTLIGLSVILCLLILIALFIYFIIDNPYKSKITTTAEITTTENTTTENTTTTEITTTEEEEDELVLDLNLNDVSKNPDEV